jgi:hypothetical protein
MKNFVLVMALAAVFCQISSVQAQYYPLGPTQGMFGYRTLGQPQWGFTTNGMFGYRTLGQPQWGMATNGMFGNRIIGQTVMTSPIYAYGMQPSVGITVPYLGQGPTYQVATAYQGALTQFNPYFPSQFINPYDINSTALPQPGVTDTGVPLGQDLGTAAAPAAAYTPGTIGAPVAQAAGMMPGSNPPVATATGAGNNAGAGMALAATPTVTASRGTILMASPSPAAGTKPFVRATELSNMLTRLARSRDMLVGERIDVYLSNEVALLRGTVRSSLDRATLANVLSLEPGVSQIDNQLEVAAPGDLSSNRTGP